MTKKTLCALCATVAITAVIVQGQRPAQATLGETVESIETDRQALSAKRTATVVKRHYTIREMATETNTVREYVSQSGIVFAIAWSGLTYPDLTPLLGKYDHQYQRALAQIRPSPGQRSSQVKAEDVVVQKWGHIRNLQGRAYAPALMPQGVTPDEIK